AETQVKAILQNSLHRPFNEIFQAFDFVPIASASIGQVHRATLADGTEVAVKIQYPDIVEAIESDFKNLNMIKKALLSFFPNPPKVDEIIEELKESILSECNYLDEAANIEEFSNL